MRANGEPPKNKLFTILQEIRESRLDDLLYRAWHIVSEPFAPWKERRLARCDDEEYILSTFAGRFATKHELCEHLRTRKPPRFFFSQDDFETYRDILQDRFGGMNAQAIADAERILAHEFRVFGREVKFCTDVDWHAAVDTGNRWPVVPWYEIDVRRSDCPGDVKFVWEINRHQHFLTLGRAYWYTADERYAREFAYQLASWLSANPLGFGVNWAYNLEIAIRAISWIWSISFFLRSAYLDDDLLFDVISALIYSGWRLFSGMAYTQHCMRNNHLIGDAAGLAFIVLFLPEARQSSLWRDLSLRILSREIEYQVYPDGVNFEQAINYHRFTLYFYILVTRFLTLNLNRADLKAVEIPRVVLERIEKMIEFVQWLRKPNGAMPVTGDWDDGRAIVLGSEPVEDFSPTLCTGAVLFRRGDFKFCAGRFSEETLWLMGPEAPSEFDGLEAAPPDRTSAEFRNGGYFVIRSGWSRHDDYVAFKNGPHANHGHADQLHIELVAHGADVLIDPGTFTYNGPRVWRTHFRSTHAHNTVVVDHASQSIPHRVFRWLKPARPILGGTAFGNDAAWIKGGHTGYRRLSDPVTHLRHVLYVRDAYVVVIDRVLAREHHDYEVFFHFPPGCHVELNPTQDACELTLPDGQRCRLLTPHTVPLNARLLCGEETDEIGGWVSPGYGIKKPAPVLVLHRIARGSTVFTSIIDFGGRLSSGSFRTLDCIVEQGSGSSLVIPDCPWEVARATGATDLLTFRPTGEESSWIVRGVNGAELYADAHVILLRRNAGHTCYFFGANITRFACSTLQVSASRSVPCVEIRVDNSASSASLLGRVTDQLEITLENGFDLSITHPCTVEKAAGDIIGTTRWIVTPIPTS